MIFKRFKRHKKLIAGGGRDLPDKSCFSSMDRSRAGFFMLRFVLLLQLAQFAPAGLLLGSGGIGIFFSLQPEAELFARLMPTPIARD